ncbi:general odorant-binding protein 1-like [Anticarsia gemmatalis]|uniref:general odorant-binding protein 1-like n=1 Tax=Anticarsia gemmatalis TaxID=129554 RepID=UPI003F757394
MASSTKWQVIAIVCAAISMQGVMTSQELMTKLTGGFAKVMDTCKTELRVGDHIIQDFYNFWKEEYELVNKDFGCMIICMAGKLDLLSEDMKMHHGNAHAFAKAHGADDDVAKQIVSLLHGCENEPSSTEDPCMRAVEISKCFRTKIHELKWAPSMEVILGEIMTDVRT